MGLDIPPTLQDLPPACAHLCLDVEAFMTQEAGVDPAGIKLAAAVSGGADSTALLLVLRYLARKCGFSLTACHLDHGLRPSSRDDARFTADLCNDLGVPLDMERVEVADLAREKGVGLEEAGREARLEYFARVRLERGAAYTATAHQLNDLAEDVLMRLGRGVGWPALSGMRALWPEAGILRPFLLTPKADILDFLRALGLPWREDPSNQDPAFARNRMRSRILPAMLEENPNFLASVARLWRIGGMDREFWDDQIQALVPSPDAEEVLLARDALAAVPPALRLRACKAALASLGPGQALAENLLKLDKAFLNGRVGATVQFPGSKTARITRQGIVFSKG